MSFSLRGALLGLVASIFLPGLGTAQVCIGVPAQPGQYHLSVGYAGQGDVSTYDVEFGGYLLDQVFAEVSGGVREIDGLDETPKMARALVGTEVANLSGASICPVLRAGGETVTFPQYDQTTLDIGLGLAAGYFFSSSFAAVTPTVGLDYVIGHSQQRLVDGDVTQTNTDSFFRGRAGIAFSFDRFFVAPEAEFTGQEGSDLGIGVEVGFFFGT